MELNEWWLENALSIWKFVVKLKFLKPPHNFERMIIITRVYLLQNPVVSCS